MRSFTRARTLPVLASFAFVAALAGGACDSSGSSDQSSTSSSSSGGSSSSSGGSSSSAAASVSSTTTAASSGGLGGASTGTGIGGMMGTGGAPDCTTMPKTYLEIINACTNAQQVDVMPVLPLLEADGGLSPLP